jgi:hypothetical protein
MTLDRKDPGLAFTQCDLTEPGHAFLLASVLGELPFSVHPLGDVADHNERGLHRGVGSDRFPPLGCTAREGTRCRQNLS